MSAHGYGYPPAGYFEELEAEAIADKYGFPLELCRLAINAETSDEDTSESTRVQRIEFLLKVLDLLNRSHS